MTNSVARPVVRCRTTPSTARQSPGIRLPVGGMRTVQDRLLLLFRTLQIAVPRRIAPAPLDRCGSDGDARVALAAAVRQQLSRPGSVPPQRQLQLILADRAVHNDPGSAAPDRYHWNPFRVSFDANPFRPLAGTDSAPASATQSYPWWDRPIEDLGAL